jgi:hypothetical protein
MDNDNWLEGIAEEVNRLAGNVQEGEAEILLLLRKVRFLQQQSAQRTHQLEQLETAVSEWHASDGPEDEDNTADPLTIDGAMDLLQRLRQESSKGGNTPLLMVDCEPVVRMELDADEGVVWVSDL